MGRSVWLVNICLLCHFEWKALTGCSAWLENPWFHPLSAVPPNCSSLLLPVFLPNQQDKRFQSHSHNYTQTSGVSEQQRCDKMQIHLLFFLLWFAFTRHYLWWRVMSFCTGVTNTSHLLLDIGPGFLQHAQVLFVCPDAHNMRCASRGAFLLSLEQMCANEFGFLNIQTLAYSYP